MFTTEHKNKQFGGDLIFLMKYRDNDSDTLSQIVTDDDSWVFYIIPESKQQ